MKNSLRLFARIVAFVLTVVLVTAVNAPRSCKGIGQQLSMEAVEVETPLSSSTPETDEQRAGRSNSNVNSTEEIHHDIDLMDRASVQPFGFVLFIPQDPLPPNGYSVPPTHRPPLA